MTTFVTVLHRDLASKILLPQTPSRPSTPNVNAAAKDDLRSYYLELSPPTSLADATECIDTLQALEARGAFAQAADDDEALRTAILAKLVVGLYVQTLELYLNEATEVETELEWWGDVERSRRNSAYYLLQTLPLRIANAVNAVIAAARRQNIPFNLSVFAPSSLRQLFPSRNILRPNTLTVALFPHLSHEPYPPSLLSLQSGIHPRERVRGVSHFVQEKSSRVTQAINSTLNLPVTLARHECSFKRKKLEEIRNERAAVLGSLMGLAHLLEGALQAPTSDKQFEGLQKFLDKFRLAIQSNAKAPGSGVTTLSSLLLQSTIPAHISSHNAQIALHGLKRPSRLTLVWPKLVLLPPLAFLAARSLYNSRDSLSQMATDAVETLRGFWEDWLLEPLKGVIKTIRAGSDEGVIVTKESVRADLESLERMAMSLAKDKLNYTPDQMAALSAQIRQGDLTPVMRIYEDDIRSPLKSALGGTLLRTLLVQVQKAKVDIDQALSGIDKLLKSQELTFAFVGVAPAFAIVYITAGYVRRLWTGSRGKGRFGGTKRRWQVWSVVRRIERLLIGSTGKSDIDSRTAGLLLLSTTHLRAYATNHLPLNSGLREGFLEDVADLENPALGREEKLRVVDRMWNAWGQVLGWRDIADSR